MLTRFLLILALALPAAWSPAPAPVAPSPAVCTAAQCCVIVERVSCCGDTVLERTCRMSGGPCTCAAAPSEPRPAPAPAPRAPQIDLLMLPAPAPVDIVTPPAGVTPEPQLGSELRCGLSHNRQQALLGVWRT